MCISSPKPPAIPPPPPPPPPPPKPSSRAVQTAQSDARRKAAKRQGFASTILTTGQGVLQPANTAGGTLVPVGSSLLT